MSKYNFYVVAGIYGSGKTTYCTDKNTLSTDNIANYAKMMIDYGKISEWITKTIGTNNDFYLDGYIFRSDPRLCRLQDVLSKFGQWNVEVIFIYANNIALYREAFKGKLQYGKIFKELAVCDDGYLKNHIKKIMSNMIAIINGLDIKVTYLCRTVDGVAQSSLGELQQFIDNN